MSARRMLVGTAVWSALLLALPQGALAADPAAGTALEKVPADAELFFTMLRMGETVATIGKSRAWQQLWNEPEVKELWKKALDAYNTDDNPLKKFLADPENKELPALAADAVSQEVFLSLGAGTGDLIGMLQEMLGGFRYGPAFQKLLNQNGDDADRTRIRLILQALSKNPERLRVPEILIGFKVSDAAKVKAQLKRLDPLLAGALADTPLKGRSKRVKVENDEFLALELDGSLVPWDQVPLAMYEDKEGEFAPLLKRFKTMKLSVAVGVRQGYLLLAIGNSTAAIAQFGGKGPFLTSRDEFKPLAKAAGRPLTLVSYSSAKLLQAIATKPEDVLGFGDLAKAGLGQLPVPDDVRKPLEKDIDGLLKAIANGLKKPGAEMAFSMRTARGWESYDYDYTPAGSEPARPLTLLNHLGGSPLMAVVWRSGTTVEDYKAFAKWVGAFTGHIEKIALAISPDAEPFVQTYRKDILPILKELGGITEKLWIPALADGQEAIVLDAKWTSKEWHSALPADRELPMLEFGIVLGVSDAAKFKEALQSYRKTLNKLIVKASELDPTGSIPAFEIPEPKVDLKNGNTFAYYPIPAFLGIDKQFQPTGGLSANTAVLALSRQHAERLLSPSPLQTDLVPLADLKRPLDSAFYFNWAGFVTAAGPWVGFLTQQFAPEERRAEIEKMAVKVMGLLRVFRSYGSATYREGGATIIHSEAVFQDIPAK